MAVRPVRRWRRGKGIPASCWPCLRRGAHCERGEVACFLLCVLVFPGVSASSFGPFHVLPFRCSCLRSPFVVYHFPFLSTNLSHAGTWPRLRGALCGPIIKVSRSRHTERLACGWRKDTRGAGKKAPDKEEVCGSVWGIDGEQVSRLGNTAGGQG